MSLLKRRVMAVAEQKLFVSHLYVSSKVTPDTLDPYWRTIF